MDPKLKNAACSGDVEFLRRAVASNPKEYFLTLYKTDGSNDVEARNNLFHLATWNSKLEFVKLALAILPLDIQEKQKLLSQRDYYGRTPLHMATEVRTSRDRLQLVELILSVYKSPLDSSIDKPWLMYFGNYTPLHEVMCCNNYGEEEKIAMSILLMDIEKLSSLVNYLGQGILFIAMRKEYKKVAEKILSSSPKYSISGSDGLTPLHLAHNSSEKVLQLLLEKHPELMDAVDRDNYNILHKWAESHEVWPFNMLLEGGCATARTKIFNDLIYRCGIRNETPLHIAARNKNSEVGLLIINGYNQVKGESITRREHPWRLKNLSGDTPLHLALSKRNEKLALHIISLDSEVCQIQNNQGISPLLAAVEYGCADVVENILSTQKVHFTMLQASSGFTVLHRLPKVPERLGRKLLGKYWWMIDFTDHNGATALDEAKAAKIPWLINLLSTPTLIPKVPFDWIKKCEKDVLLAFVDNCKDLPKICQDLNDTPLHHVILQTYEEYMNLLKKPSIVEIWNFTNLKGETPLHRALDREDGMLLAKALLLQDGVRRNIEDNQGRTAMSILAKLGNENPAWEKMCEQIHVNPNLKTKYLHPGTNVDQMRSTLSVVASLLATITFTAGFTLPGGLDDKYGNAIMAKKAAFLVFLLADAYALCTSILVLFCLIWSMVPDRDMTFLLIDRSVSILMHALFGTMFAFMSGIFAVVKHNSLWIGLVIIVMCTFVGIAVDRTYLVPVVAKLIPRSAMSIDQRDQAQTFDEEKVLISKEDKPQTTEESSSKPLQNSTTSARKKDVILKENQGEPIQVQLLEEKNRVASTKDESGITEEISTKPLQTSSTPFAREKHVLVDIQEDDNQIRLLEEGNALIKIGEDDSNVEEKDPLELLEEGEYEKKMVKYREEANDKYSNEIHVESLDERKKKLISDLETNNDLLLKALSYAEKFSNGSPHSFPMEQSQQQMSEQSASFERQRVEFERQRVEWERQRLELEKERLQKDKEKEEETKKLVEVLVEIKKALK